MTDEKHLKEVADIGRWFAEIKAPDLKEKIEVGISKLISEERLDENYRKLFGFMLFSHSMNKGPLYFFVVEELAEKIGVVEELKSYANDWINNSKKNQTT